MEEAIEADLLLHVVDLSFPNYESQVDTVKEVLRELKLEDHPTLTVFNKIDLIAPGEEDDILRAHADREDPIAISAAKGLGIDELRARIVAYSQANSIELDLQVPQTEGRLLAQLHQQGEVLEERYEANDVLLKVRLEKSRADRWQLERFAPA